MANNAQNIPDDPDDLPPAYPNSIDDVLHRVDRIEMHLEATHQAVEEIRDAVTILSRAIPIGFSRHGARLRPVRPLPCVAPPIRPGATTATRPLILPDARETKVERGFKFINIAFRGLAVIGLFLFFVREIYCIANPNKCYPLSAQSCNKSSEEPERTGPCLFPREQILPPKTSTLCDGRQSISDAISFGELGPSKNSFITYPCDLPPQLENGKHYCLQLSKFASLTFIADSGLGAANPFSLIPLLASASTDTAILCNSTSQPVEEVSFGSRIAWAATQRVNQKPPPIVHSTSPDVTSLRNDPCIQQTVEENGARCVLIISTSSSNISHVDTFMHAARHLIQFNRLNSTLEGIFFIPDDLIGGDAVLMKYLDKYQYSGMDLIKLPRAFLNQSSPNQEDVNWVAVAIADMAASWLEASSKDY
ncbi:Fc.00g041590.m01.CDS01 [Cosmosporella sp. VM-42]